MSVTCRRRLSSCSGSSGKGVVAIFGGLGIESVGRAVAISGGIGRESVGRVVTVSGGRGTVEIGAESVAGGKNVGNVTVPELARKKLRAIVSAKLREKDMSIIIVSEA
jgi:hypothetical protein